MLKIGEVAANYDISNRTLRYWEEVGILKSCRRDNGYRYYDEDNIKRIKQIIMLRMLDLPIRDIQSIFLTGKLTVAIDALTRHLEETNHRTDELKALGIVLEQLIMIIKSHQSLDNAFKYLDVPNNSAILKLKEALEIILSEREKDMSISSYCNTDVRIVNLPRMTVASYSVISEAPEKDCWEKIISLIKEYSMDEKPCFRHFGFGFNNSRGEYGYEMWVVVPEDFKVPKPFERKDFHGGLFAALPTYLPMIGERCDQLQEWVTENEDFELDFHPGKTRYYLEECLDYNAFNSKEIEETKRQLDLLLPIKRITKEDIISKSSISEIVLELEPKKVVLHDINLAGCFFEQKEKTFPWKKHVPWYKLAQCIYKTGKDFQQRMEASNNTFTLLYGETRFSLPFYLDSKEGFVSKVFGGVEINQSFESYPEGLVEQVLQEREYLVFSVWISPEIVTRKKLPNQKLYKAAAEYILKHKNEVDFTYCLEIEYRKDGGNVDRIELYIPKMAAI